MTEEKDQQFRDILPPADPNSGGSIEEIPAGETKSTQPSYLDFPIPEIPTDDRVCLNGIDFEGRRYLVPPLDPQSLEQIAMHHRPASGYMPETQRWVDRLNEREKNPRRAPPPWVDPRHLDEAGWAVVFPEKTNPEVVRALRKLLDWRAGQTGKDLYKEFTFRDGYRSGHSTMKFQHHVRVGTPAADAKELPYYILLVGSPEEIPLQLQYELDFQYAVGRIYFDNQDDYKKYAESVVNAEQRGVNLNRAVQFFSALNGQDPATTRMLTELMDPMLVKLRNLQAKLPERQRWEVQHALGPHALKRTLHQMLQDNPSALLFLGGHGAAFPTGHHLQKSYQGSLFCSDWEGPGHESFLSQCFSIDDLHNLSLLGRIFFQMSCFSAATPDHDQFEKKSVIDARGEKTFIAALPQHLLAQGALAFVGHSERAWGTSFSFLSKGSELNAYLSFCYALMVGHTVGHAMEWMNQRYGQLAVQLANETDQFRRGPEAEPEQIGRMWLAHNDARNYLLLGDPAVRLMGGKRLPKPAHSTISLDDA